MLPPEVIRDFAVISDIVNRVHAADRHIDEAWISGLIKRYGMTYPGVVSERDCRALEMVAEEFRAIFWMNENELAEFSNKVVADVRFSPRIMNHGGYGWHIHYYDENFSLANRIRSTTAMSIMSLIIHNETPRIKTCKAKGCGKVFIDNTRNASKLFCDVKTCGNRSHVARHRAKAERLPA